jgi:beta-galactosidase
MRFLPLFLLLLPALASAANVPGETRLSLDGQWRFTIDEALSAAPVTPAWDTQTVPGNWDLSPQYSKHRGTGWYSREITPPADWKGKRVRLRFEAVYHAAQVTLNGEVLGEHIGGYTPFEFDVTDKLKLGAANTLLVRADNDYRRGAWWAWGGISRSVDLIANGDARIVFQHIHAEPDLAAGTARIAVRYKLANAGAQAIEAKVVAKIPGTGLAPIERAVTLPPKSESFLEIGGNLAKKDTRLWHFDKPELYTLETQLKSAKGGEVLHGRTDRFGIRKAVVDEKGLIFNGERIRVPGFNRVSDSNQTGNLEPDALVRKDVDMMKSAGSVMMRIMHTPNAPNLLDYMDEKGMLIFAEIPVWGTGDPQVKKDNPRTKQWLREMIERDYNHPCIIGWSVGNEITEHYNYVKTMIEYVRGELDPHRMANYVSFTAHWHNMNPSNDPVGFGDIAMINCYGTPHDFKTRAGIVRAKWPDKPVFFSEYGSRRFGNQLTVTVPHLEGIWEQIEKDPYVIGGALWTFNDYRSSFKDTPASGNRDWGVVDVDRNPKAAYWQIRPLYAPVQSISVQNGAVTVQPRTPKEIPSYTLRGYNVRWTLADDSGKTVKEGTLPVPELAPGAAAWQAAIPGADGAASVRVALVTPTGYEVAEFPARRE